MRNWKFMFTLVFILICACTPPDFPELPITEIDLLKTTVPSPPQITNPIESDLLKTTIPPLPQITSQPNVELPDTSSGILLSVRQQGGLCMYGLCARELIVYRNSAYQIIDGSGEEWEGTLAPERVVLLYNLTELADFDVIRAVPFTDVCPTAYDGSKFIYSFYTSNGVEIISSCKYAIDENSELFAAIFALLSDLLY